MITYLGYHNCLAPQKV